MNTPLKAAFKVVEIRNSVDKVTRLPGQARLNIRNTPTRRLNFRWATQITQIPQRSDSGNTKEAGPAALSKVQHSMAFRDISIHRMEFDARKELILTVGAAQQSVPDN
ncbi:hypothetical protein EMPG_17565 [Blastomyces silverae]|uniref:Uncharacterized protein n=1 Tax=Blastomyces silverae TaxID=2060906 RepID=A0A0H1B7J2_9EURO|nr:hypothetical protein EMPG_17565 [Blastomyces silverae]